MFAAFTDWTSEHRFTLYPHQNDALPAGHWTAERAAADIVTLARKGRAFASLDAVIARQGGQHVLFGSTLALAAALQAWSQHVARPCQIWSA